MASSCSSLPQKQFHCAICQRVFTDPVTTPCGHNFCQACIQGAWEGAEGAGGACRCPTCDRAFSPRPEMSINTAFKELADSLRNATTPPATPPAPPPATPPARPGEVVCDVCAAASLQVRALKSCLVCLTTYCEQHLEPHQRVAALRLHRLMEPVQNLQDRMCKRHERLLEMFCRDEQKCVCRFCTETEHKGHRAVAIEAESANKKVQIKKMEAEFQVMIQERLKKMEEIKSCVKLSTASGEREKKESDRLFSSLIRSLEERRAEAAAEMEEKRAAAEARAEELVAELLQEVYELRRRSSDLRALEASEDHLHVLQRFPALAAPPASRRWKEIGVHPELCVGTVRRALSRADIALRHKMDALKTEEMKRMHKYAVDVVLDPDTAHPNIVLSADGKQAGRGELLHLVPDIPQRFDPVICVLGKDGFLSGRFYFQVAVGTKTFWDLGVVRESINRKGMITSKPENGYWTVRLRNGDEYRALDSPSVRLPLVDRPRNVGVFVDYEEGTVSFFDVDTGSHMYSFTGCLFSERIFPFLSPGVSDDGKNAAALAVTAVNPET